MTPAPDVGALIAQIKSFLADAPKGKPHTGYRYGELLEQAAAALAAQQARIEELIVERDGAVTRGQMMLTAKNNWEDCARAAEADLAIAQSEISRLARAEIRIRNLHADAMRTVDKAEAALRQAVPREPYLGLATTKQLIDELASRAEVSAINGEAWPSYWTAMPDGDPT